LLLRDGIRGRFRGGRTAPPGSLDGSRLVPASGLHDRRSRRGGGVHRAITSTARQVGSAIGVALAGGLVAGRPPEQLAVAARPGWLVVAACGMFLFVVAAAARNPR
jgi:hypothetical protein